MALRIGGAKIFGGGIAVTAALTLVTPWLVKTNVYLLLGVRIIEGIFEVRAQVLKKMIGM